MTIIQKLHDSEINASVASFYDSAWTWKLGDDMNGFREEGTAESFEACEAALSDAAKRHYPDSAFAKQSLT